MHIRQSGSIATLHTALLAAVLMASACGSGGGETTTVISDEFDLVFSMDKVHQITINPSGGWSAMVDSYLGSGNVSYLRSGFGFDEETLTDVGLRIKGVVESGIGKSYPKYSLKLNFDYFGSSRFHSIDKIHLGNNNPDPSMMREALTNRLLAEMGVPVSRIAFAWVKADSEDLGLYTMIQDVDKRFFKDVFGTENHGDDGNLYKCTPPGCDLTWQGSTRADYVDETCGEEDGCGLILRTNEDDPQAKSYSDLISFLDFLNNTDEAAFKAGIEAKFDVDSFLRYLAVAVVVGDYDGYLGAVDNFYLYHRPDTDQFLFIPWDHNKTYGAKSCKNSTEPTGGTLLTPWCDAAERPLVTRILAIEDYQSKYLLYVQQVLGEHFTEAKQQTWINEMNQLLSPLVGSDPGYTYGLQFHQTSLSDEASYGDPYNLMEYVKARRAFLQTSMEAL